MTCFSASFADSSVPVSRKYFCVRCQAIRKKYSVLFAFFRKGVPQGGSSGIISFSDMTSDYKTCSPLDSKPYPCVFLLASDKRPHLVSLYEYFPFS